MQHPAIRVQSTVCTTPVSSAYAVNYFLNRRMRDIPASPAPISASEPGSDTECISPLFGPPWILIALQEGCPGSFRQGRGTTASTSKEASINNAAVIPFMLLLQYHHANVWTAPIESTGKGKRKGPYCIYFTKKIAEDIVLTCKTHGRHIPIGHQLSIKQQNWYLLNNTKTPGFLARLRFRTTGYRGD